ERQIGRRSDSRRYLADLRRGRAGHDRVSPSGGLDAVDALRCAGTAVRRGTEWRPVALRWIHAIDRYRCSGPALRASVHVASVGYFLVCVLRDGPAAHDLHAVAAFLWLVPMPSPGVIPMSHEIPRDHR